MTKRSRNAPLEQTIRLHFTSCPQFFVIFGLFSYFLKLLWCPDDRKHISKEKNTEQTIQKAEFGTVRRCSLKARALLQTHANQDYGRLKIQFFFCIIFPKRSLLISASVSQALGLENSFERRKDLATPTKKIIMEGRVGKVRFLSKFLSIFAFFRSF